MLEAMGISIAANLATKVIEKVSQKLGEHIKPSNLKRAYKEAVSGFITSAPEEAIDQGVLESFFQSPKVVDELSKLVITTEGIPDLKLLAEELVKAGFDISIAPEFDFSRAMREFTDGFLNAAVKDPDLSRIINTRYLRQIAETIGALAGDEKCKIGIIGKEVEADVTYIGKVVNNYYFAFESVTSKDLDKLRKVYFTGLVDKYEWMDFRGILQLRNIVRLKLADLFYNDKASKERYDLQSVPLFPIVLLMLHIGFFNTPCDFIYETFRDFVVRWEEKKSSHTAKATSFSYTPRIKD